jgi:hypothetical protein
MSKGIDRSQLKSPFVNGDYSAGGRKITRARKKHVCQVCKIRIEPGQRYVLIVPPIDSDNSFGKQCVSCAGPDAIEHAKEARFF